MDGLVIFALVALVGVGTFLLPGGGPGLVHRRVRVDVAPQPDTPDVLQGDFDVLSEHL